MMRQVTLGLDDGQSDIVDTQLPRKPQFTEKEATYSYSLLRQENSTRLQAKRDEKKKH